MNWLNDLMAFFDTPMGKMLLACLGVGTTLMGIGYWVGDRLGKGKAQNWRREKQLLESQAKATGEALEKERRETARLQREADERKAELDENKKQFLEVQAKEVHARKHWRQSYQAFTKLKPLFDDAKRSLSDERALVAKLTAEAGDVGAQLRVLKEELERREAELDRTNKRIQKALKLEGNLWAAKALQKVPRFKPLTERKRAIISVLNLKGGVGKTTVAAHLGIALARKGYRVLLVDLDLQGSLTQMLLPFHKQEELAANKSLMHHFLTAASVRPTEKILGYAQEVFNFTPTGGGAVGLVAASDNLAYAEMSLTLGWLLRSGERDNRFLLRKALHLMAVNQQYDIVLLDCPPLVNISCINALAASDSLLVPVTLGQRATDRVPVLLRRFLRDQRFLKHINHRLGVLGVVANRTYRDELTGGEQADWNILGRWCLDAYGQDVKRFDTIIPQMLREIRDTETLGTAPPAEGSKLAQVFAALASELERELPSECRRGAATHP